jgi:N-hydroxyarylamine O-acetyltransferase
MDVLSDELAGAYLDLLEIDVERGAVDAAALARLQVAHVQRVPYETLDIVLGRPPGIDPASSARRVVGRRGGYCYHLNGAFSALLGWLGVDVTRHVAGVQNRMTAEPVGPNANHMALTATLPDGSRWLVDVGLGNGPVEPLPLAFGDHHQRGFRYTLGPSQSGEGIWRFDHDARGGFFGFDVDLRRAAAIADFTSMHAQLSTNSHFTRTVTAQRWSGDRIEILRGCVLTELTSKESRTTDVTESRDWWSVVIDRFGLAYGDLGVDERDRLWASVSDGHRGWVAAGRP